MELIAAICFGVAELLTAPVWLVACANASSKAKPPAKVNGADVALIVIFLCALIGFGCAVEWLGNYDWADAAISLLDPFAIFLVDFQPYVILFFGVILTTGIVVLLVPEAIPTSGSRPSRRTPLVSCRGYPDLGPDS